MLGRGRHDKVPKISRISWIRWKTLQQRPYQTTAVLAHEHGHRYLKPDESHEDEVVRFTSDVLDQISKYGRSNLAAPQMLKDLVQRARNQVPPTEPGVCAHLIHSLEGAMPGQSSDYAELTVGNVRLLGTAEPQAVIADLLPVLLAAREELDLRTPCERAETVQ
jgi:hypothetical protein